METISCHSSYLTGIKSIPLQKAMSSASMPSFIFILLTVSEKKNFEYFFENLPFLSPRQPIIQRFGQRSYETWRTTQLTYL